MTSRQMEFEFLVAMFRPTERERRHGRTRRPTAPTNAVLYSLAIARELHKSALKHELFNLMLAVAVLQHRKGAATITDAAESLGITYNAVCIHLKRHDDLFRKSAPPGEPFRITLTPAATTVLREVQKSAMERSTRPKTATL